MLFKPIAIVAGKIKPRVILLLILSAGLLMRLYNLAGKPLWYDEACSVANAQKSLGYFFGAPYTFNYKMLYFLFLKGWIKIFGQWEYSMRALSVIFGLLAIYMIYKLALLLYNHNVGLWSAFFLSLSAFHVYHSQQVRQFTLYGTLTIISFYFFFKLLLGQKNKYILLNAIANFLLLCTHPYGILIVILQYGLWFIFARRTPKVFGMRWIFFQSISVIFYLIFFLIPSLYYLQEKVWWIPKPKLALLVETFFTFVFGGPRYGLEDYAMPVSLLVVPAVFSIAYFYFFSCGVRGIFSQYRIKSKKNKEILSGTILLSWFFSPLVIAYVFSYVKPVFLIKHLIYVLPAFIIIVARGIEFVKKRYLKKCLIVAVLLCSLFSLHTLYHNDYNINWRRPAEYIYKNSKSDEAIAICTSKEVVPFIYYFDYESKDKLRMLDIYGNWTKEGWEEVFKYNNAIIVGIQQRKPDEPLNPFKDFRNKYAENKFFWRDKNIWLAVSKWGEADSFSEIERKLYENHSKIMVKEFDGVTVSYWKKL